jgi:hypothetical protein
LRTAGPRARSRGAAAAAGIPSRGGGGALRPALARGRRCSTSGHEPPRAALSPALALALAEAASWLLLPQWAPENGSRSFWRFDERLGWSNRPGASGVHLHPDFAPRVEINAEGLRDRSYPEARVPGLCRMLVVGDSFTGLDVEREEIWHERIERATRTGRSERRRRGL